jgi:hypothetical protein
MSLSKIAAFCITTLLSLGSLAAQTVRFVPLNDEIAATKIGIQDAKGITKLKDLNPQKRSIAYKCKPGKIPLKLVAMDRPDATGKPATVEITLPESIKVPLILILSDPGHASGLRTIAIEDSNVGFTWGSLRFINVTPGALMVRCGAEVKQLPEGNTPTDFLPGGDARNMGVQLFKEEEPDKILYSGVWEHDPKIRKLIVITSGPDPTVKELGLLVIPETNSTKK